MMTKTIIFCLLCTFFMASCHEASVTGQGPEGSKQIVFNAPSEQFSRVLITCNLDITLHHASQCSVELHGYENLFDYISFSAEGGTLVVQMEQAAYENLNLHADIYLPELGEINTVASADIDSFPTLPNLRIYTSEASSGTIRTIYPLSIADKCGVVLGGSTEVVLEGKAGQQEISISGTGNYNAFGMECGPATVFLSGSGNASVNLDLALTADISSSGNVYYKGNPTITSTITGSGAVIDAN